ncbi:hypothetical protein K7X08_010322 [Anisodus acutangulus]|uniref:Uncharacterized protein n=1 Tax=Anisodus acutangulus TaxID=402998 RepID=A0A9Q1N5D8_9SOLA|nr:hypothetical protein K7X08_010322 [Anisodus acutangulus]
MRLFNRSLTGEASEWFTTSDISRWDSWEEMAKAFMEKFCFDVENVPDRYSLENIKQNHRNLPRSHFYRPDQTGAYYCGENGHLTEDCINLKHKLQDLIDKRELILEAATPNVNTNALPNHGANQIHMIKREEDWMACQPSAQEGIESLEHTIAFLALQEKPIFKIPIPAPKKPFVIQVPQVVTLAPKTELVVVAQGMTRSGRCYAPKELAQEAPHKEINSRRHIADGEGEDF